MKQKLILLALVMGLTIVSQSSLSLGMGKIQVYSALNEPLQSSIDLLANSDEELLNLEVTLASSEDYQKVGLDKSFVPANIMVSFDEENPYQINVTSNGPVSEPIVSLLLDVNWSNGRILREFTVLLDPPVYDSVNTNTQFNNVVVEPMQDNTISEPVIEEPVMVDPESELQVDEQQTQTITNEDFAQYEEPADNAEAEITQEDVEDTAVYSTSSNAEVYAGEIYVEAGDTLWRIANNNKVGDLSAQQMMMAIYNKNPGAFNNSNINQLIKGSRLDMPTFDEASNIGFSEAMAQVESHHQSWAPAQQDYNTYQTEEIAEDDYQEPTSTLDYGVQLSGGDNQASDGGQSNADQGTATDAQAVEEDLYNKDAENSDLKERISELEDIVEQQQDVIEISDDGLANLENQLDNAADDAIDNAAAAADDIWDETTDAVDNLLDGAEDELTLNVDAVEAEGVDPESDSLQASDFDTSEGTQTDESLNVVDVMDDDSAAVAQTDTETTAVTPAKQQSFVDTAINWVIDNLMWVLIGLVALIVLLFLPKVLRSSDVEEADETSFLDDIKNRKASNDEDDIDDIDTKMNQPLHDDSDDEVADTEGDVLAELDRSIDFDESGVDKTATEIESNIDDELTELNEEGEFEVVEEDGFDLDGFLNDDDNDDITTTKDHSATLAAVSFDDDDDDEGTESNAGIDLDEEDDMSFDDIDLNLDDEIEELSDDVEEAVEDDVEALKADVEDVADEVVEKTVATADKVKDEADEFSFDDDEEFDFDLDEELEELAQTDEVETADADNQEADDSEEFNDVLDISDEGAETFEITDEEASMDEEIDLGLEDLMDDADAIDTKLDLAKAYIDMGDSEGAKNLLDEIFSEGTEEQIAEAKKLLDDINPAS